MGEGWTERDWPGRFTGKALQMLHWHELTSPVDIGCGTYNPQAGDHVGRDGAGNARAYVTHNGALGRHFALTILDGRRAWYGHDTYTAPDRAKYAADCLFSAGQLI